MEVAVFLFVILIGLAAGSFANVCVYRMPRGLSVAFPGSFCPVCRAGISWHRNIPIVSWLLLKGRCADCGARIPWRYPAIEGVVSAIFAALYFKFGVSWAMFVMCPFAWMLVTASAIDIEHRIIPDEFSAGGAIAGAALSPLNPFFDFYAAWHTPILLSLLGAAAGLAVGWIVAIMGEKLFGKEAFGGGDIKLLAACGAYMGAEGALWTLLLASFIGSGVSIALIAAKKIRRSDYVPFGPFLAAGALVYMFYI